MINLLQRLSKRAAAYRAMFASGEQNEHRDAVLQDLANYCYATKPTLKVSLTTQQTDPYAMAFAEGRRDVFNRITSLANLTQEQIHRIANHRSMNDEN